MLKKVAKEQGRLPKKSDFSVSDVNKIKGIFGPWPHALTAAELKDKKGENKKTDERKEDKQ